MGSFWSGERESAPEAGDDRISYGYIRIHSPTHHTTSFHDCLDCKSFLSAASKHKDSRMAPDLNSLPPSRSPSGTSLQSQRPAGSLSPRSSSLSLAASATINAGIQNEDSRRSSISSTRNRSSATLGRRERRRSNVAMNLNLNDPSLPGPGELQTGERRPSAGYHFRAPSPHSISGSPILPHHHQRAPSLGELHQELEAEQEAQVVRGTWTLLFLLIIDIWTRTVFWK